MPCGTQAPEQPAGPQPWQSIRPAKVAKARRLVRDEAYPSRKILNSVAEILAENLPEAK